MLYIFHSKSGEFVESLGPVLQESGAEVIVTLLRHCHSPTADSVALLGEPRPLLTHEVCRLGFGGSTACGYQGKAFMQWAIKFDYHGPHLSTHQTHHSPRAFLTGPRDALRTSDSPSVCRDVCRTGRCKASSTATQV